MAISLSPHKAFIYSWLNFYRLKKNFFASWLNFYILTKLLYFFGQTYTFWKNFHFFLIKPLSLEKTSKPLAL
jgi:hypothetical protein